MKRILLLVLLTVNVVAYAQRKPKIKGNRNVMEVREDLPSFNAIRLDDNLEVYLQEGPTEGYVLEADDNLVDLLKFRVVDGTLSISSYYAIRSRKKLKITVFFNRLNAIKVTAGRVMATDRFRSDGLDVAISGAGSVELTVNTQLLNIGMEGNSNANINMEGDSLKIDGMDRSKLKLYAVAESTAVQIARNSNIFLEGFSHELNIKLAGQATLKASQMESNIVKANLGGNTSAEVYVVDSLELRASGASKTYVYGTPKIDIQEFLDTSELYKRKK